jgi:hypothetical protein
MERKFHQDDFDQFLKDNADDLRMKPSGAVWENISKELNRKKRRVAAFFLGGLTLLSGGLFTWYTLHLPNDTTAALPNTPAQQTAPKYSGAPNTHLGSGITTFNEYNGQQQATSVVVNKPAANIPNSGFSKINTGATAQNIFAPQLATEGELAMEPIAAAPVQRSTSDPAILLQAEKYKIQPGLRGNPQSAATTAPAEEPEMAATTPQPRKKRLLSWSVFATPTVSYRKLSENKTFDRPFLTPGTPPMVSALYNINNAVIHKPDLGLEFGVAAKYALTKRLKLRSGFQFNISRYDIKAFSYIPEVATIALSNGFGVDSVRAISSYRNFNNGSRSNWLQNMYFQASLPVGLEYEVAGNKKVKWNVAGAIQPTYVIGNRSYMITADYKNYARVPWLTRHWNMNTNVETFVTVQSGKTEWHIGPQMRYQVLSSFVKKYPVKENLFDFGMKVGVTIR